MKIIFLAQARGQLKKRNSLEKNRRNVSPLIISPADFLDRSSALSFRSLNHMPFVSLALLHVKYSLLPIELSSEAPPHT